MEILLYGPAAVGACVRLRPAALREIYVEEGRERAFGALLDAAPREGCARKTVSADELARLAGTRAHGGVAARTERPEPAQVRPAMRDAWHEAGEKVLFLENVAQTEQLASIARTAAICGFSRVVADEKKTVPAPNDAGTRATARKKPHQFPAAGTPSGVPVFAKVSRPAAVFFTRSSARAIFPGSKSVAMNEPPKRK